MTGFGRSSLSVEGVTIEVSVKSVNGRYLEVRPHLPKKYFAFETEILKTIKGCFERGTVDVYIQRTSSQDVVDSELVFKTAAAKKWLADFRKSLRELKLEDNVTARDLLAVPEFLQTQEAAAVGTKEKIALLKVVKKAADLCGDEREREGRFLRDTCLKYIKELQTFCSDIRGLRQGFVESIQPKMEERLKKILENVDVDPVRIVQEAAYQIDKTDIEEEIHRLGEHLKQCAELLSDKVSHGKKLDFYAQELIREINTIGSKSHFAKITERVVLAKNSIEQLREQIQNIE